MSISPTDRCNLRCKYCYNHDGEDKSEYDIKELVRIVDEFISLGCQSFLIQGGEPLVYNEIKALIQHIKSKGCYCAMTTNGVLIDSKITSMIGLDRVQLSLDGLPEINDFMRGKGVYDKVVNNLKLLKDNGIPFELHSVVSKGATSDNCIKPMAKIAKEYDTAVSFCMACDTGSEENTVLKDSLLSRDEYFSKLHEVKKLKEEGYCISNPSYSFEHTLKWPLELHEIGTKDNIPRSFKYPRCIYGHLSAWLFTKGEMYPCPRSFYIPEYRETIYGEGGIKGAWERWSKKLDCVSCSSVADTSYMFNLKPAAIKSALFHIQ